MKFPKMFAVVLASLVLGIAGASRVACGEEIDAQRLDRYTSMLTQLRTELVGLIPSGSDQAKASELLASDKLDARLVKCVVLLEATPKALAEFAQQGKQQEQLIEQMLSDPELMKQMLVADGATAPKASKREPAKPAAQYGPAMRIYADIQSASPKARDGVLQHLALAIALEYAAPTFSHDPVQRYLSYEKAYLAGELDPAFKDLTAWDLRFVVDGNEPDWMHDWGREMLRNYRPDHVFNPNLGWRYVRIVSTNVKYGSERQKFDRPELHTYQNILMNGGVCGRRAFFGRFILRSFGIPTVARPSRRHGALAHWTPNGWVINLGPGWGAGWTDTLYSRDKAFLTTTQARRNPEAYLQVKRAQWIGDVIGEPRAYGGDPAKAGFWNGLSLRTQQRIIDESKAQTLAALGENLAEADDDSEPTIAEQVMNTSEVAEQITSADDGTILIPAAVFNKREDGNPGVSTMKSFAGGEQIYLGGFGRMGFNLLRGGGWKSGEACSSESRIRATGLGGYENWGFRVAVAANPGETAPELTLECGNGVTLELVYIKPGTFVMGGVRTEETKYWCLEVPKHEVTITRGFYLGKYEVTRAQWAAIKNLEKLDGPTLPMGGIRIDDAEFFCMTLGRKVGRHVRLPTEAEWEYAARAGRSTRWFFGDGSGPLAEYAVLGNESAPVGQKKPNPWGLYDIYGNVWERVSDSYDKDYYANSPKNDPAGPVQDAKARIEYTINVPQAGKYALAARVVTVNYEQSLNVAVNDDQAETTMAMPFTCGKWQDSEPVVLSLKQGENVLRFSRRNPPQYGMAVKSFTVRPIR